MDQSNEVYAKDYELLQQRLKHYPAIEILSVEKDPPEQYVIEYKLSGYGSTLDDSVQVVRRHRVEISLPFGYPHFPPTVKPLTGIYHPDVDENAVRIADHWQRNQSLADLVVHIGDMIRGKTYSKEGAFNSSAAAWYAEHNDKLPLSRLEYIPDPDAKAVKPSRYDGFSLRPVLTWVILLLMVVGGSVLFRDFYLLRGTAPERLGVDRLFEEQNFTRAKQQLDGALTDLSTVLLLKNQQQIRVEELSKLLNSERMQQGLAGRIEVDGQYIPIVVAEARGQVAKLIQLATELAAKGDVESSIKYFADAKRLAEEHDLKNEKDNVSRSSAKIRLDYFLSLGNNHYESEMWQEAGDYYAQVVDILKAEKEHLEPDRLAILDKTETLRVLSLANYHQQEAKRLEQEEDYSLSAENYRAIAAVVSRSLLPDDEVLSSLAVEAIKEAARVEEQTLINAGNEYLMKNYKELFKKHYPGVHGPALQSPRTKYVGRSGNNLVFVLSSIELIKRSSNEFRLFYQFDPLTGNWSLYREKK